MATVVETFIEAFGVVARTILNLLGFSTTTADAPDPLANAIILAILAALLGAAGYIGKNILTAIASKWEERKKFKSAQIRYIYDAEIWMRDFRKKFNSVQAEDMLQKILKGGKNFKFGFGSSKDDDEDAKEIKAAIHWLRTNEIYTIRCFLTYGELFDSSCDFISSDAFAEFSTARKVVALQKTIKCGIDCYEYAQMSVRAMQAKVEPVLLTYGRRLWDAMMRLVTYYERDYLTPPAFSTTTDAELEGIVATVSAGSDPGTSDPEKAGNGGRDTLQREIQRVAAEGLNKDESKTMPTSGTPAAKPIAGARRQSKEQQQTTVDAKEPKPGEWTQNLLRQFDTRIASQLAELAKLPAEEPGDQSEQGRKGLRHYDLQVAVRKT